MVDSREVLQAVDPKFGTVPVIKEGVVVAELQVPTLLSAVPSVTFPGLRRAVRGGFVPGGPGYMIDVQRVAAGTGNQQ